MEEGNACTRCCYALTASPTFQSSIVGLIVLNTVAMAMERYPMDPVLDQQLELLNTWLTLAFAAEVTPPTQRPHPTPGLALSFSPFCKPRASPRLVANPGLALALLQTPG